MGKLQVSVLGPITATHDGHELPLSGKQPRAVLAILALAAGRVVTAEQLIDDLWSEQVPPGASNTLQSYVSAIRRAAGDPQVVQRRGPGYVLAVDADDVDALRFESMLDLARSLAREPLRASSVLDEALGMWRGRPLIEVESEAFARAAIVRLNELHAEALERRFDAGLALGRHVELVASIERAAADHPWRERFAAQLALAQYRSGRQADALRTIDRLRTRLVEDLGISPADEIAALETAILNHDPALLHLPARAHEHVPAIPRAVSTSRVHSMHGRAKELADLVGCWDAAIAGTPSVVVVTGEAGVGKTRLIAELAAHVHDAGGGVVWGRCTDANRVPYEPFVETIATLAEQGLAADNFADLISATAADDGDLGVITLHHAVAQAIAGSMRNGGALIVDDLHWSDRSTTAMLTHVAAVLLEHTALIVVGRRSAWPNRDADVAIAELRKRAVVHRIDLEGLAPEAIRQVVIEVHGADDALADRLHARTGGNPFFVRELLATTEEGQVPATITEAVALRVGPSDQPLGRLLGAAAVLDRDADIDLLADVARLDEDDALDALDAALAGDLLREAGDDDCVSFSHAIVRDTAYQAMTAARRRHLHRQAAAAIAARHQLGRPGRHQVEIAKHLLAAGSAADPHVMIEAAEAASSWCLDVLAYDAAIEIAEAALDRVGTARADDAHDRRRLARLQLHMARALNRAGQSDRARERLRRVLETGIDLADGVLVADTALAMSGGPGAGAGIRWGVVDGELVAALEAALAIVPDDQGWRRVRLLTTLAQALYNAPGEVERCDRLSAEAIEIAESLDDDEALGYALVGRCVALWRPSHLIERLQLERRAIELADRSDAVVMAITAHIRVLPDAFEAADLELVDASLRALDVATAALRQPRFRWFVPLARSARAMTAGDLERASVEADLALAVAGEAQAEGPALSHLVGRTMIARDRGESATIVEELRVRVSSSPVVTPRVLLGTVLSEAGRVDEAHEVVAEYLADRLAGLTVDYLWLGHLGLLTEIVVRGGTDDEARALGEALTIGKGRLLMLGATAPVGAGDRAVGLLRAVCGDLDAAVDDLRRGRDLHRRIGARYLEARSEADLSFVRRALADLGRAERAASRCAAICDELGLPVPTSPLAGRPGWA